MRTDVASSRDESLFCVSPNLAWTLLMAEMMSMFVGSSSSCCLATLTGEDLSSRPAPAWSAFRFGVRGAEDAAAAACAATSSSSRTSTSTCICGSAAWSS